MPCRLFLDDGDGPRAATRSETIEFPVLDQYSVQGDAFADGDPDRHGPAAGAARGGLANMGVIDAVFRSAASGHWESPAA